MAVSAFVAVPVGSVPFTLQVYVVLLTGLVLGVLTHDGVVRQRIGV